MSYLVSTQIDKFLKYLENIESCSALTIKAYRLDLSQAFLIGFKNDHNKNKKLINFKDYKSISFKTSEELWGICRNSLNQWGSLSLASRNRKIATLKSFFNWLYQEKIIDKNYADQLICPKVPKKIPHFISVDEVISVMQFLNSNEIQLTETRLHQKTLFTLLYGAGLRISEACNLKWKDIQFTERKILILGKGNKERYVVIPEACASTLENHKNKFNHTEFVFGEVALNPRKGYEYIRTLGQQVGLANPLHPHSLRHSFATHLLASGTNLRTLQTLLGHESLQATEKYTHLNIDMLARTVEAKHPLSKKKI